MYTTIRMELVPNTSGNTPGSIILQVGSVSVMGIHNMWYQLTVKTYWGNDVSQIRPSKGKYPINANTST